MKITPWVIILCLCTIATAQAATKTETELVRTWQRGYVWVSVEGVILSGRIADFAEEIAASDPQAPVILYAHGCSGIDLASTATAFWLAQNGYTVFMPDSFARRDKPVSCIPEETRGGLHRAALSWRQAEISNALAEIKALSAEPRKIALMGLSEGGNATATWQGPRVDARVIEGWGCHAAWEEYRGLKARADEPVLSFVGDRDPWFQRDFLRGSCGAFMTDSNKTAVTYSTPDDLAEAHYLMWNDRVRARTLAFLDSHMKSDRQTKTPLKTSVKAGAGDVFSSDFTGDFQLGQGFSLNSTVQGTLAAVAGGDEDLIAHRSLVTVNLNKYLDSGWTIGGVSVFQYHDVGKEQFQFDKRNLRTAYGYLSSPTLGRFSAGRMLSPANLIGFRVPEAVETTGLFGLDAPLVQNINRAGPYVPLYPQSTMTDYDRFFKLGYWSPEYNGVTLGSSYAPRSSGLPAKSTLDMHDIIDTTLRYKTRVGQMGLGLSGSWGRANYGQEAGAVTSFTGFGGNLEFGALTLGGYTRLTENIPGARFGLQNIDQKAWAFGGTYRIDRFTLGVGTGTVATLYRDGNFFGLRAKENKTSMTQGTLAYRLTPRLDLFAGAVAQSSKQGSTPPSATRRGQYAFTGVTLRLDPAQERKPLGSANSFEAKRNTTERGFVLAIEGDLPARIGTGDASRVTAVQQSPGVPTRLQIPETETQSRYGAELGYQFANGLDLVVKASRTKTGGVAQTSSSISNLYPWIASVPMNVVPGLAGSPFANTNFFQSIKTDISGTLDKRGADLGLRFLLGENKLRLRAGVARLTYYEKISQSGWGVPFAGHRQTLQASRNLSYRGTGPKIGFDIDVPLSISGFSLLGRTNAAYLFGKRTLTTATTVKRTGNFPGTWDISKRKKDKHNVLYFGGSVGVGYDFAPTALLRKTRLELGYRFERYRNLANSRTANQTMINRYPGFYKSYGTKDADIENAGVFARVTFQF